MFKFVINTLVLGCNTSVMITEYNCFNGINTVTKNDKALQVSKGKMTCYILLLVIVAQTAVDIYIPSLPHIVTELHTNARAVQITIMMYFLGFSTSQVIYGPLSDHIGRKPIALFGLLLFTIGSIVCTMANSITVILIARIFEGFGAGAPSVMSRAIARDIFNDQEMSKIASYIGMAWSVTPILAPLAGGYIQNIFGWRFNFAFLVIMGAALFFMVLFLLPETLRKNEAKSFSLKKTLTDYKILITSRHFLGHVFCVMILYGVFIAFNQASTFIFQNTFGMSAVQFGWSLMFVSFGYLIGSFINSRISQHVKIRKIMLISYVAYLLLVIKVMMCAIFLPLYLFDILVTMFLVILSIGFIYPNCLAGSLNPFAHIAGSASALYGFILFIGVSLTSFIASNITYHSIFSLAVILLGQAVLVGIVYFGLIYFTKNE